MKVAVVHNIQFCDDCPYLDKYGVYCMVTNKDIESPYHVPPDWCPLDEDSDEIWENVD